MALVIPSKPSFEIRGLILFENVKIIDLGHSNRLLKCQGRANKASKPNITALFGASLLIDHQDCG